MKEELDRQYKLYIKVTGYKHSSWMAAKIIRAMILDSTGTKLKIADVENDIIVMGYLKKKLSILDASITRMKNKPMPITPWSKK